MVSNYESWDAEKKMLEEIVRSKVLRDAYRWHRMFINGMYRDFGIPEKPRPINLRFDNDMPDNLLGIHELALFRPANNEEHGGEHEEEQEGSCKYCNPHPAEIVLARYSISNDGWMEFMHETDEDRAKIKALASLSGEMLTPREFEAEIRARRFDVLHETGHYLHLTGNPVMFELSSKQRRERREGSEEVPWAHMVSEVTAELGALVFTSRFGWIGNSMRDVKGDEDLEGAHRIYYSCKTPQEAEDVLRTLARCTTLDEVLSIEHFRKQYEANKAEVREELKAREKTVYLCEDPEERQERLFNTPGYIESLHKKQRDENRRRGARR